MAHQKGIFKITGTIGDVTFYKSKNGYLVREKGGIDAKRIATDPAFQRTRENGMEFGRAGKAGKVLRAALRPLLTNVKSSGMASRMTQIMIKVIQADMVSERGLRNVIDGEAELLTGFEFNQTGALSTTFHAPYTAAIDRVTGEMTISVDPFVPVDMITAPQGTTHFKITSGGAEIDFEQETFENALESTLVIPYSATVTSLISHILSLPANSTKPLFLALGIEFYQDINGRKYALKNGSYNPLAIIKVDGGV
ncbi:hypothetical protein [Chryseobacterium caseinilyticum]|uniref:Phage tail protein n=1 Tax=Chryseobacterium caseinilyticum TaxID=2771428 RepID=A0ABR8ZIA8_9FLAO|nr:hypothetical protein [Chryseobacterium caseinilyticum]MBD8084640.1 hypothetical protein [Chryseobacterium caseinilyticum]